MRKFRIYHQLSGRLFILLIVLLIGLLSVYTYLNIRFQQEHLMRQVIGNANRASELIQRSTRYSMLLNRKQDVYHTMRTIGQSSGFDGIRIYNKTGVIIFSTDEQELEQTVDMSTEACNVCHRRGETVTELTTPLATRIFQSPKGYRVLGLINPIKNGEDCSSASCHAHPTSQTILGVLDVKMSLAQVDETIVESRKKTIVFFLLTALIVALVSGIFIWRMVHVPVRRLISGTRALSNGDLEHRIDIDSLDEIGELSVSFDRMTEDLRNARNEITNWSETLAQRVKDKTRELKKAQGHLIQGEKMASLGKLSASVAHEINNPLSGVLTYTKLVQKKLNSDEMTGQVPEKINHFLSLIQSETSRCGQIVKNLLLFARKSNAEFRDEDLGTILDKCLQLIEHHLEIKAVKLEWQPPEERLIVSCNANQLQQAFIALFINAVESMDSGGELAIELSRLADEKYAGITIADNGHGISKNNLPHIFEPFFTTKQDGKGVGLGLSVVYGIIRHHSGEIKVSSEVNKGTVFTLELPFENVPSEVSEEV
ncbi:sensor histidine kinase [Gemmatimonadota bacterium]